MIDAHQGLILRREKRTDYLDVPYRDSKISFRTNAFGLDTYGNLDRQIQKAGLLRPTLAQIAQLVHAAWNTPDDHPSKQYALDILEKMNNCWLRAFNGLLYEPQDKGVYIEDRPQVKDGKVIMDRDNLVRKLEAHDPSVRFVPFGTYQIGEHSPSALAKNKFIQVIDEVFAYDRSYALV